MPETVDDFIQHFSNTATMDDRQAQQYYDHFASTDPGDRDFDNEALCDGATQYLGRMPDEQFMHALTSAYIVATPEQRRDFLGSLLGSLRAGGVDMAGLSPRFASGEPNPEAIAGDDFARLATYARAMHPEAMRNLVREQPALLKAMDKSILVDVLRNTAAHMVRKRQSLRL